jgi:hypothetical protein
MMHTTVADVLQAVEAAAQRQGHHRADAAAWGVRATEAHRSTDDGRGVAEAPWGE